MATTAFVLIQAAVGKVEHVATAVRNLEGVKLAHGVTGPYDVIALVEGPDLATVDNVITKGIHKVEGVTKTVTCLAVLS